jgi:hypothetical protein
MRRAHVVMGSSGRGRWVMLKVSPVARLWIPMGVEVKRVG